MERFGKKLRTVFFVKHFEGTKLVSKRFLGKDQEAKARAYADTLPGPSYLFRRTTYKMASVETTVGVLGGAHA